MDYIPVGCWAPRGLLETAVRPRRWNCAFHAPVSIRFDSVDKEVMPGHRHIVRWTYDRATFGTRLCLTFAVHEVYDRHYVRWRTIADQLWKLLAEFPHTVFHDIPVDISDCGDGTVPPEVLRFAKRPGDPHLLLPNLHLIHGHSRLPPPLGWQCKSDTLYFRGAATGAPSYEQNVRVALCRCARSISESDCRISSFEQVDSSFIERARLDGLVGARDPRSALNMHRYLLDVDGNTSSWDRFWLIGWFGGVPIRFEPMWEEYWHAHVRDGEHYVSASRHTLADVVQQLRDNPDRAMQVASAAARIARKFLAPDSAQRAFRDTWLQRIQHPQPIETRCTTP